MGPNAATGPHLLIITVQYGTVLQNIKAPLQCTLCGRMKMCTKINYYFGRCVTWLTNDKLTPFPIRNQGPLLSGDRMTVS